jgi:hypothetical protein
MISNANLRNAFCILAVMMTTLCVVGCSLLKSPKVEEIVEEGAEFVIEESAAVAGEDIEATIDLNPNTNPRCKKCHLHCPKLLSLAGEPSRSPATSLSLHQLLSFLQYANLVISNQAILSSSHQPV